MNIFLLTWKFLLTLQKCDIVWKNLSSFLLPLDLPIWIVYDSFGNTSVFPLFDTYLTKLYKSSFLSLDNFSKASTSATTIKLFFALVTATLVISELFFIQSNVFYLF